MRGLPAYEPTEEEIKLETQRIRSKWTEAEKIKRSGAVTGKSKSKVISTKYLDPNVLSQSNIELGGWQDLPPEEKKERIAQLEVAIEEVEEFTATKISLGS